MYASTPNPPPNLNLPAGWTYHELNAQPFYYHAASNTIQQDPPPMVTGGSMNTTTPATQPCDTAMYPEPASEPVPSQSPLPPAVQHQPGVYTTCAPQQPSAQATVATVVQPSAYAVPQQAAPMPQLPLATLTGASPAQINAQAMAQPSAQRMQPQTTVPTAQPVGQQMVQLQVLVPDPGLRAGQKLAFTAPPPRPGLQPQPMVVTVNQQVAPGAIVTVQYAAPAASRAPTLPALQYGAPNDREQMQWSWLLYAAGCGCLCCSAGMLLPVSMLLWVVTFAIYFCRPARHRSQMPQTRTPAYLAALTCLGCLLCGLLMIPVAVLAAEEFGCEGHYGQRHVGDLDIDCSHRHPPKHPSSPGFLAPPRFGEEPPRFGEENFKRDFHTSWSTPSWWKKHDKGWAKEDWIKEQSGVHELKSRDIVFD